jgi:hypothetical protein
MLRERVIRNVLARYVRHDPPVASKDGRFHPIPHFLLNDVVRYWRTMASDYASKMWERGRKGWGIRNIKLRFSRKVLFAWGILAAFSGDLFPSQPLLQAKEQEAFLVLLSELIREQTDRAPLELLALVAAHPDVTRETVIDIFTPYDEFLATLSNPETRRRLDDVEFDDALEDDVYDRLRVLSQQFRKGIQRLFFDEHPQLRKLIRNFGVF